MAMCCRVCSYEMSVAEFSGHLTGMFIAKLTAQKTRGLLDAIFYNWMTGTAAYLKICCPVCKKFEGWQNVESTATRPETPKSEIQIS